MNRGPAALWGAAGSHRRIAAGLVVLVACIATVAGVAIAQSGPPTVPATAVDAKTGVELPPDPQLDLGQKVIVTAVGFHPGTSIQIALEGVKLLDTAPAGADGHIVFPFTVPNWIKPGQHALLFVGRAAHIERGPVVSDHRGPRRDEQNIQVLVPLVDPWKFRTPGGSPSTSPSLSVSGSSTQRGHGHGHGPPGNTGFGALPYVIVGVIAIALGAGLVAASSRRRRGKRE